MFSPSNYLTLLTRFGCIGYNNFYERKKLRGN
jgi:hypothetical protein